MKHIEQSNVAYLQPFVYFCTKQEDIAVAETGSCTLNIDVNLTKDNTHLRGLLFLGL